MHGEIVPTPGRRIRCPSGPGSGRPLRVPTLRAAQQVPLPGSSHIFTPAPTTCRRRHCESTGRLHQKAPGGWPPPARRSRRAWYLVERNGGDLRPSELWPGPGRAADSNLLGPSSFPPTPSHSGGITTPSTTPGPCSSSMTWTVSYLRPEQSGDSVPAASTCASAVIFSPREWVPGPARTMDVLGLGMADGSDLRILPDLVRRSEAFPFPANQDQGHETPSSHIFAHERPEPGRTSRTALRQPTAPFRFRSAWGT